MSQLLSIAVDKLFSLKAEIATLRKEEEELKDFLIDSGLAVIDSDTVHCTTEILGKRESKSHPGAGIVELHHRAFKQDSLD